MQGDRKFNPQTLDEIIDAAMPGYSGIEPRPGLERRILANAATVQQRRSLLQWASALAVFALAAVILISFVPRIPHRSVPNRDALTGPPIAKNALPHSEASPRIVRSKIGRSTTKHRTSPQALPMLDVFPSPSPLTSDERAALALSRNRLKLPAESGASDLEIAPIRIAALEIQPLRSGDDASTSSVTQLFPDKP